MFATDRDLLVLEPRLLQEVAWLGQRVHSSESVTIGGGGATVTDASGPFGASVDVGAVLLLDDLPVEVVEVTSATQAGVSLIRASVEAQTLQASSLGPTARMEVFTFGPQLGLVHAQVLRGLGIEAGVTEAGGPIAEDRIVGVRGAAELEALGALHLIYAAGVPLAGDASVIERKAARYRERFRAARFAIGVEIDLDGDGVADATRRVGAFQMVRR